MNYFKGIVIFILIVNLISEFIMNDSYKKYMKHISGIILVLIIIKPVSGFFGEGNMERIINKTILESNILESKKFMKEADNKALENMTSLYEDEIEKEIEQYLNEKNIDINDVKAQVEVSDTGKVELTSILIDMKFINYDIENQYIKDLIEEKFLISKERIEVY